MCGIFGIYSKNLNEITSNNIEKDINLLSNLSRTRGQDTFGLSISINEKENIFKINADPKEIFKRKDFKSFIKNTFKNLNTLKSVSIIGQTRLVTNGTKFLADNNQPIITKNIIGVHNGIIVNKNLDESQIKFNKEGHNVKSDSLNLFEDLSSIFNNDYKNFYTDYIKYLNQIDGNYSISFRIPSLKLNFLSSNCGSLYFINSEEYLIFASEKQIL